MANDLLNVFHNNPLTIQGKILADFESTLAGGNSVADGNNVFSFLVEQFATITADAVNAINNTHEKLYPVRAQKMSDLFRHMSEYDLVNMFASPAEAKIMLQLDKTYLWNNAQIVSSENGVTIKQVTIPDDSIFMIGSYQFGIYRPINITMQSLNTSVDYTEPEGSCVLVAKYADVDNPLNELQYNSLVTKEVTSSNTTYVGIDIPIYQFVKTTYIESLNALSGFTRTYTYSSMFYALRVYTQEYDRAANTIIWKERNISFSEDVYPTDEVTLICNLDTDLKQLKISIPQVFFTTGMIGGELKLEIYTTEGKLDVDISAESNNSLTLEITHADTYSAIFNQMPYLNGTIVSSKIYGGSNIPTFEECKDDVVYHPKAGVKITESDITSYFNKLGYQFERFTDGITDRIYKLRSVFTNSAGVPISIGCAETKINMSDIRAKYQLSLLTSGTGVTEAKAIMQNIIYSPNSDSAIIITPNARFIYDATSDTCTPAYLSPNPSDNTLNNNLYTFTPFHVRLDWSGMYPSACGYDLDNPEFKDLIYVKDPVDLVTQLNIVEGTIYPYSKLDSKDNLVRGYRLVFSVSATSDLAKADFTSDSADVILYLEATSNSGTIGYITATPILDDLGNAAMNNDQYLYEAFIATNYLIRRDNSMELRFAKRNTEFTEATPFMSYALEFKIDVNFLVRKSFLASNSDDIEINSSTNSVYSEYAVVIQQQFTLKLGEPITNLNYLVDYQADSSDRPEYPSSELMVYPANEYKLINNELVLTHAVGSVLSEDLPIDLLVRDIATEASVTDRVITLYNTTQNSTYAQYGVEGKYSTWYSHPVSTDWLINEYRYVAYLYSTKSSIRWNISRAKYLGNNAFGNETLIAYGDASCETVDELPEFSGILWPWETKYKAASSLFTNIYINRNAKLTDGYFTHLQGTSILGSKSDRAWANYLVTMPQIDAKFLYTTPTSTNIFFKYCQSVFRDHIERVLDAKQSLLENTKLWYEPIYSLGNASYILSNTTKITLPLAIALSIKVFVAKDILNNELTLQSIRNQIQTIIDRHFSSSVISCTKISSDILSELADIVKYVDILGINNDPTLQTLVCTDKFASPHVKHYIVTKNGISRTINRSLNIEFTSINS